MAENYNHKDIEKKWQEKWEADSVYKTAGEGKPKQFILDMFPYPSGEGLHVGHPRGYIATDVYSRMKRMQGYDVLHPMGWDAFGLPAENFAIKNKVHPSVAVEKNVARFKEQLSIIGLDYDWSREINTTDPEFYKWTQWIFLQMFKKGLAYESYEPINWCPSCQTGLANEDVEADGTCERCGTVVEKKPMRQWVLKITDYADRLLADLDKLPEWPHGVKEAQRHWIGRSEGSEIDFTLKGSDEKITIFTTRADTLFGVTYVVLAPEHPLVERLKDRVENKEEVEKYVEVTKNKTSLDREQIKEKTGVVLEGIKAINPANNEEVPVWIADYVLASYGTGAVMAVPAHDERDAEFAKKYNLPVLHVISRELNYRDHKEGVPSVSRKTVDPIIRDEEGNFYLVKEDDNNVHFAGGGVEEGEDDIEALKREILEETGFTDFEIGNSINLYLSVSGYRSAKNRNQTSFGTAYEVVLRSSDRVESEVDQGIHELIKVPRDQVLESITWEHHRWIFEAYINKTQAYTDDGILIQSKDFDGLTSEEARTKITEFVGGRVVKKYKIKDWVFSRQRYWGEPIPVVHCEKCGVVAVPESELPVTLPSVESYEPSGTGESPLANISDWVNTTCPECGGPAKRETNTMPQWAGSSWYYLRFIDPKNSSALVDKEKEKNWMPVDVYVGGDHATRHLIYARFWHKFLFDIGVVSTEEPFPRLEFLGFILAEDGRKMSKRWGNIVNPDEMVDRFGADAFRLYEMFIGPFENTVRWNTDGVVGTYRFLEKIWKIAQSDFSEESDQSITSVLNRTIAKVDSDIESFKFNTAVSSMMIFINEISGKNISKEDFKKFLQLLAPFAPHITEELWSEIGETSSIHLSDWPKYDEKLVIEEEKNVAVSFNGKGRGVITVPAGLDQDLVLDKVFELGQFEKYRPASRDEIKNIIFVKDRIINIIF